MKIVDDILGLIDKGSLVAMVCLDISTTFDIVNHNLLLVRVDEEFRIIGTARDWIEFDPTSVLDNSSMSAHRYLTCAQHSAGPHGSVL